MSDAADPHPPLAGLFREAWILVRTDFRSACDSARHLQNVCRDAGAPALLIEAMVIEGMCLSAIGQFDAGLIVLNRASLLACAHGELWPQILAAARLSREWARVGALDEAVAHMEVALDLLPAAPQPEHVHELNSCMGLLLLESGRPQEALPLLEESYRNWSGQADATRQARVAANLALALLHNGMLDRAEEVAWTALRNPDLPLNGNARAGVCLQLARVGAARGDDAAVIYWAEQCRQCEYSGGVHFESSIVGLLASAALNGGRLDEARHLLHEVDAMQGRSDILPVPAVLDLHLRLARELGDEADVALWESRIQLAREKRNASVERYRLKALQSTLQIWHTRMQLAQSHREQDRLRAAIDVQSRKLAERGGRPALVEPLLPELCADPAKASLAACGFDLHYQPVLNLVTLEIEGCEALVRLTHPLRGNLLPFEFISRLEASEEIAIVGRWILHEACRQLAQWPRLPGGTPRWVAVNLAASQLEDPSLVDYIDSLLKEFQLAPGLLELEITESQAMRETGSSLKVLHALSDLGLRVAIDDFGTGYSNHARLTERWVHKLKIDRSLCHGILRDARQHRIVQSIVETALGLDLQVTAEGVENVSEVRAIQMLGCELLQGFVVSRPLPAARLNAMFGLTPQNWSFNLQLPLPETSVSGRPKVKSAALGT